MILTSHKEYKRTVTISKRIFNFDDCYAELLQDKMLYLMKAIQDKFKEEISNEIFYLNIKRISYELTPVRVFCHCFFFFFFAVEEIDLLIIVQFAVEFLLIIAMLQEKLTGRLL